MPELQCIVVTPEQTVREQSADFVVATLFDGEIGIGSGHSPMIGRLGCGELRIRHGSQTDRFYIEGGFIEVINNVVSLLTQKAIPAEKIDVQAVRQQIEAAQQQLGQSSEKATVRDQAIASAKAQLHVAEKAKV